MINKKRGPQAGSRQRPALCAALILMLTIPGISYLGAPSAAAPGVPLPPAKPAAQVETVPGIPLPPPKPQTNSKQTAQKKAAAASPAPRRSQTAAATLSGSDAALYKEIFALQAKAEWDQADTLIAKLRDHRLHGHVLYQRYMHPFAYRSSFDELAAWLGDYADLPGAARVHRLARSRMPAGYKGTLPTPQSSGQRSGLLHILSEHSKSYSTPQKRSAAENAQIRQLGRDIRSEISRGNPEAAHEILKTAKAVTLLDPVEHDQLLAQIANSHMMSGDLNKARQLAEAAVARSGQNVPQAGWVGGLVAWRQGDYSRAATLFETAARSPYNSQWGSSGHAYWTSRALLRAGQPEKVSYWLKRAAAHPRTFYGLIATRTLGWEFDFNWDMPAYRDSHRKALEKIPAARRAQALVAAGQYHLAEEELRQIDSSDSPALREALLAYANHAALPSFAMQFAHGVRNPRGGLYDAALYPLAPWEPEDGFTVDKALIHALIRQESRFDPYAENRSGATGLMQLMPATASYIAGDRRYKNNEGRHSLKDPRLNIELGQLYIENLLGAGAVGNDLFALVAAYNAGPGNLARWKRRYAAMEDDPLLFIESIPLGETRAFVEKVMANYWIYRLRLGQPTPSLDAVAEGRWAKYVRMDDMPDESYRLAGYR